MESWTFSPVYRALTKLIQTRIRQIDSDLLVGTQGILTERWIKATVLKAMAHVHVQDGYLPYDSTYKAKINVRIRKLVEYVTRVCDGDRRGMVCI